MDIQEKEEYQEKIGSPEMEYIQYQIENPQIQSKTMDINKIIEEDKKEFHILFGDRFNGISDNKKIISTGTEIDEIFNWHTQSLIKFLDAEIERLENPDYCGVLESNEKRRGYDIAMQEVISHLQDIKSRLSR